MDWSRRHKHTARLPARPEFQMKERANKLGVKIDVNIGEQ